MLELIHDLRGRYESVASRYSSDQATIEEFNTALRDIDQAISDNMPDRYREYVDLGVWVKDRLSRWEFMVRMEHFRDS